MVTTNIMHSNNSYIFFLDKIKWLALIVCLLVPFFSIAMDTPVVDSNTIILPSMQPMMGKIQDLKARLGKNQWMVYTKGTNDGIVVGIDFFVQCDDLTQQGQIDQRNISFTESLLQRIEAGKVASFSKEDVDARTIPCDFSPKFLKTWVDILMCAQKSRLVERKIKHKTSYRKVEWSVDIPTYDDITTSLKTVSLDQLIAGINLFKDLGICYEYQSLNVKFDCSEFLLCEVLHAIRSYIGNSCAIIEEAFFNNSSSVENIEKKWKEHNDRHGDCSKIDGINKTALFFIKNRLGISTSVTFFKAKADELNGEEANLIAQLKNLIIDIEKYEKIDVASDLDKHINENLFFGQIMNKINVLMQHIVKRRNELGRVFEKAEISTVKAHEPDQSSNIAVQIDNFFQSLSWKKILAGCTSVGVTIGVIFLYIQYHKRN